MTLCINAILILLSALLGTALGYRNSNEGVPDLKDRIRELGEKSTQLLIFLSFAIAAVVLLGYGPDSPSSHQISDRIAKSGTLRWWVSAIFPVVIGVLPLKEFRRDNPRWYRIVRWFKFWLLWAAVGCIVFGAVRFFHAL